MNITTTEIDENSCILTIDGRLDVKAAREAEEAFADAAEKYNDITLDMENLDYIASAGLRVLKRLVGYTKSNGGSLVVKNVSENVMEVLEMTGFAVMLNFA